MDFVELAALLALGAGAASLAYAVALERRVSRRLALLEERLGEVSSSLNALAPDIALIKRSLGAALSSLEAERVLELLRRRRRRRYIAFYVVYEGDKPPAAEEVEKAILRGVERLAGQLTVASSRLQLVFYDPSTGTGIVRATHDTKYLVLAGMALVRMIGGKRAVIIPVRTSGTIKRARRALGIPRR